MNIHFQHSTLTLSLSALKQSKLSWVVHHSELVEQCLDDLSYMRLGAYMQVLGCILGEVERCPPLHLSATSIFILCAAHGVMAGEGDGTN